MKNNYNPYTVPDNFFEQTGERAMKRFRNRRRALFGVAAMTVAAALIITPLFIHTQECRMDQAQTASNDLACMYEYDIFLQVNFTK